MTWTETPIPSKIDDADLSAASGTTNGGRTKGPNVLSAQPAASSQPPGGSNIAYSAEPTRLTYLIRRSVVGGLLLALLVGGVATAARYALPGDGASGANDAAARVVAPVDQGVDDEPQPTATTVASPNEDQAVDDTADDTVDKTGPEATVPDPVAAAPPTAEEQKPVVGYRTSRFDATAPQRLVDTRADAAPKSSHVLPVPQDATAVALSISLVGSTGPGVVTADGRAGTVPAISVGSGGVSASNLVIVPVVGSELTVETSAGGALVVDIVGSFEASDVASSGRFVSIDPVRVATLDTAADGREVGLRFDEIGGTDPVSAVLVSISADVGADGGMVQLGPDAAALDQMMMWGPATTEDRQRRGLALIETSALESGYLHYDGGTLLTADVVGYFTGEGAQSAASGLYVASGPRLLFSGPLSPGSNVDIDGLVPGEGTAVISVAASDEAGQGGSYVTQVEAGVLSVTTTVEQSVELTLLGVFAEDGGR